MDAASDRDFALDALYCAATVMTHLSRVAEDLILYSTEEFSFISLPDGLCTGSSLMPHKKNPDALGVIRGKAAIVTGKLFGLFCLLKGLPSTYDRDLQEDKPPLFEGMAAACDACAVMTLAVEGMGLNRAAMEKAVEESFMPAVEMTEYLAYRGVPFRQAHHIVGAIVKECEETGRRLAGMDLADLKRRSDAFDESVFDYMDPRHAAERRKTQGGASFAEVERQIAKEKDYLSRN